MAYLSAYFRPFGAYFLLECELIIVEYMINYKTLKTRDMNSVKFRRAPGRNNLPSLFEELFNPSFFDFSELKSGLKRPQTNIIENENGYTIELAVPGINKEDVEIKVEKDQLIISSISKNEDETTEADNYTRREFNYSAFSQSFHLPETIDKDAITANYKDGVLAIALNKKEEAKTNATKTIEIK
ncbi:MAG: Hsp20/alpha crystallin family protein [Saprospiraceae bacterium]|nr:Hsp20/alpha crystallin family protein [Saprospiraceae bacterium]